MSKLGLWQIRVWRAWRRPWCASPATGLVVFGHIHKIHCLSTPWAREAEKRAGRHFWEVLQHHHALPIASEKTHEETENNEKNTERETKCGLSPSCWEKENPQQKPPFCPGIKKQLSWSLLDKTALPSTTKLGLYPIRGTRRKRGRECMLKCNEEEFEHDGKWSKEPKREQMMEWVEGDKRLQ